MSIDNGTVIITSIIRADKLPKLFDTIQYVVHIVNLYFTEFYIRDPGILVLLCMKDMDHFCTTYVTL